VLIYMATPLEICEQRDRLVLAHAEEESADGVPVRGWECLRDGRYLELASYHVAVVDEEGWLGEGLHQRGQGGDKSSRRTRCSGLSPDSCAAVTSSRQSAGSWGPPPRGWWC
jgi:hypothetical protein